MAEVLLSVLADGDVSVWDLRVEGVRVLGAHRIDAESVSDEELDALIRQEEKRLYFSSLVLFVDPGFDTDTFEKRLKSLTFFGVRPSGQGRRMVFVDDSSVLDKLTFLRAPSDMSLEDQLFQLERTAVPHQITPQVYLGDFLSATNREILHVLGIKHVVNASNHFGNKHADEGVHYLEVNVDDYPTEDLQAHFKRTFDYVDSAPGPVLIHCLTLFIFFPFFWVCHILIFFIHRCGRSVSFGLAGHGLPHAEARALTFRRCFVDSISPQCGESQRRLCGAAASSRTSLGPRRRRLG